MKLFHTSIAHHARRAIEELERAEAAASNDARRGHERLAQLHLYRAQQFRRLDLGEVVARLVD